MSAYTLPTPYTYTGAASSSYDKVYSITSISSASRTFTSAVNSVYTSTVSSTGLLTTNYTYAPSGVTASLGNDNLIFVNSMTNAWTTSGQGFAFALTTTGSTPGAPGLPGFPRTARFNTATILLVNSIVSGSVPQLQEVGYGLLTIDGNIGAAAAFTPYNFGTVSTTAASSLSATPSCPAAPAFNTAQNYITQGFCYTLYPHETVQNGMWSIAASGLLLTSPIPYPVPGSASGSPNRLAYFIYGINSLTRTFTDQYGTATTVSGAFMQGPNGDGGTDNFLYTTLNTSDPYGGLVRQALSHTALFTRYSAPLPHSRLLCRCFAV